MKTELNNVTIELVQGDITDLDTDAIVNAANSQLILGAGVAGAIRRKGGSSIQEECYAIGYCEVGDAAITGGGNLKARHVIHAVGPVWAGGSQGEDAALASCYISAIGLCQAHGLATVAFPAISTGVYRFPPPRAARIAVSATVEALQAAPAVSRVIFCCFSRDSAALHEQAMAGFGSPCTD